MSNSNISCVIPTFNRDKLTCRAVKSAVAYDRVAEVIVVDDASTDAKLASLETEISALQTPKVRLVKNPTNLGMFRNKLNAIRQANNEWVILLDSDNYLMDQYMNSIPTEPQENFVYCPTFSHGANSDYRFLNGTDIDLAKFRELLSAGDIKVNCFFNTGNTLLPKTPFLRAMENEPNTIPYACDSVFMLFLWLKYGESTKAKAVEGMEYFHETKHPENEEKSNYVSLESQSKEFFKSLITRAIHE